MLVRVLGGGGAACHPSHDPQPAMTPPLSTHTYTLTLNLP